MPQPAQAASRFSQPGNGLYRIVRLVGIGPVVNVNPIDCEMSPNPCLI
ncbi:MAG TPA: hypothetical protein VJ698_01105 [Noviherbaspirillum sp.]|nr:hypothetical protein [Noviherbaspirillum sp.]HJV84045.1 hypothetical protein [Noviherbaspirillum sp.]